MDKLLEFARARGLVVLVSRHDDACRTLAENERGKEVYIVLADPLKLVRQHSEWYAALGLTSDAVPGPIDWPYGKYGIWDYPAVDLSPADEEEWNKLLNENMVK